MKDSAASCNRVSPTTYFYSCAPPHYGLRNYCKGLSTAGGVRAVGCIRGIGRAATGLGNVFFGVDNGSR
jgi:hypothetical protein